MPQSTYGLRRRAYAYFDTRFPNDFDLYGVGWNAPRNGLDRLLGYRTFATFRHPLRTYDEKVHKLAEYRFALAFENNPLQAGYISEKIMDCFCARCVPVYYGWEGAGDYIPREAWIDLRDFPSFAALADYLVSVDEARYNRYVQAMEAFLHGPKLETFTNRHIFATMAARLLPAAGARHSTAAS
jgi:hypothetical protein